MSPTSILMALFAILFIGFGIYFGIKQLNTKKKKPKKSKPKKKATKPATQEVSYSKSNPPP